MNQISQNTAWLVRGGLPETQDTNSEYRDLLIKFEQYKEKVLSKNNDERELNLYIEPLTRSEDEMTLFPNSKENLSDVNDDNAKRIDGNNRLTLDSYWAF